jgi:hypothetical protein
MGEVTIDEAVKTLKGFVDENCIEVLNVTGRWWSRDGLIYGKVFEVVCF